MRTHFRISASRFEPSSQVFWGFCLVLTSGIFVVNFALNSAIASEGSLQSVKRYICPDHSKRGKRRCR